MNDPQEEEAQQPFEIHDPMVVIGRNREGKFGFVIVGNMNPAAATIAVQQVHNTMVQMFNFNRRGLVQPASLLPS